MIFICLPHPDMALRWIIKSREPISTQSCHWRRDFRRTVSDIKIIRATVIEKSNPYVQHDKIELYYKASRLRYCIDAVFIGGIFLRVWWWRYIPSFTSKIAATGAWTEKRDVLYPLYCKIPYYHKKNVIVEKMGRKSTISTSFCQNLPHDFSSLSS